MRCHICDTIITNPQMDHRDGSFFPCDECQDEINEAIGEFEYEDGQDGSEGDLLFFSIDSDHPGDGS